MNQNNKISLNVGGKIFTTTKTTLNFIPYFKSLFDFSQSSQSIDTNLNEIFVDSDPSVFKHVLRWARNPTYSIPIKYDYGLNFWGLPSARCDSVGCDGCKICDNFDLSPSQTDINKINSKVESFVHWVCFKQLNSENSSLSVGVPNIESFKFSWMIQFPICFKNNLKFLEAEFIVNNLVTLTVPLVDSFWEICEKDDTVILDLSYLFWKTPEFRSDKPLKKFDIKFQIAEKWSHEKSFNLRGKILLRYEPKSDYDFNLGITTFWLKCVDLQLSTSPQYYHMIKNDSIDANDSNDANGAINDYNLSVYFDNDKNVLDDEITEHLVFYSTEKISTIVVKRSFSGSQNTMTFDFSTKFLKDHPNLYIIKFLKENALPLYSFKILPKPNEFWFFRMA